MSVFEEKWLIPICLAAMIPIAIGTGDSTLIAAHVVVFCFFVWNRVWGSKTPGWKKFVESPSLRAERRDRGTSDR